MAAQPWRTGTIIRIEDETSSTKRFWIQIPELDRFDFIPGQFVTLDQTKDGAATQSPPPPMEPMYLSWSLY